MYMYLQPKIYLQNITNIRERNKQLIRPIKIDQSFDSTIISSNSQGRQLAENLMGAHAHFMTRKSVKL